MSNRIFAVDIREDGLCAVLIRTGLKGNVLERFESVTFPPGPADPDRLARAMETLVQQVNPAGAVCLVSMPPSEVSLRNLQVPFKDKKKIRQVLPFELEPTLPFEIDRLRFDFMAVRQADQTDLIVAAVETEKIDELQAVFGRHEITPRFVTVGAVAAALCVARFSRDPGDNFLLVEMDRFNATACVVAGGRLHLVRTLRKSARPDPASSAEQLATGIQRMLAAFETVYDFDPGPEKLLLSGLDDPDPEFVSGLEKSLEIPVTPVNVVADTRLNLSTPENQPVSCAANVAVSLAGIETAGIRPFNFNPGHYALQKYWAEHRKELISTAVLAALVFFLFLFQAGLETRLLQKRVSVLNGQITEVFRETFPDATRIVDPVQQMRARLKQIKEQSVLSPRGGADIRNIDILRDISRLIPAGINVVITRFVRGDESVQLAGLTDTFNSVDEVKMRLEKSSYFSQIVISSANMDKTVNRVRFRIKADLAATQP